MIAALALTDNTTAIIATFIGSVVAAGGLITVAIIQIRGQRETKAVAKDAKDTLGSIPEGHDDLTVVKMLQQVLEGQTGQDNRLAAHDALHAAHDRRFKTHEERLAEHAAALERLVGPPS